MTAANTPFTQERSTSGSFPAGRSAATVGGADALGRPDLGRLAPGAKACWGIQSFTDAIPGFEA